jgi:hypothetical protein
MFDSTGSNPASPANATLSLETCRSGFTGYLRFTGSR